MTSAKVSRTVTNDDNEEKASWFSRMWLIVVLLVLAIASGLMYMITADSNADAIAKQQTQMSGLEADLETAKLTKAEKESEALKAAVGLDSERKQRDEEMIASLMDSAATWSTGAEYDQGRAEIIDSFGVAPDSQFLTEYLPEQPSKTSRDGSTYYEIDMKKLNSKVSNIETSVINIDGSNYTYLSLVDISSNSRDGKESATNTSLIRYTVDADGNIVDISGMISSDDINN